MVYSREEVLKTSKEYFRGDDLAARVWIDKYSLRDKHKNIYELTPDDMHHRIARELYRIESNYSNPLTEEEIYNLLKDFKYIVPQGSPMFGIGNNFSITSLSNCFVIGNNNNSDSYSSIMRTDEEQVQLMKRRGGVGHDISHLRPSGSLANNAVLGSNAGSTLYMHRYSNSTREVAQDGRRGALMLSISVQHPDSSAFVDSKLEKGKVTGANISVKITDEFMEYVKSNGDYWQTFPLGLKIPLGERYDNIVSDLKYNELTELPGVGYIKKIRARELWEKIVRNAWKSAEPGILFWDTITRESPAACYGKKWKEVSTNPCGEIPLCPYDSCRLLAINLYSYVDEPFTVRAKFNWDLFRSHVNKAQRMMDDIVDLEIEKINQIIEKIKIDPEPEDIKQVELNLWKKIKQKAIDGRRTGLGITGEGDMLAALGLRYGTNNATDFSVELHKVMAIESYKASIEMAEERGCFPIWDYEKEKYNPFINRIIESNYFGVFDLAKYSKFGRRNIANLTIAPTGTTSLMTQTTSGIEPVFMPVYKRRRKIEDKSRATFIDEVGDMWEEYPVFHHKFVEWFRVQLVERTDNYYVWYDGISYDFEDVRDFLSKLSIKELDSLVRQSPYYKATSNDVDYIGKVEMQGRIQKWIDHSISVTVNVPEDTKEEVVSSIYLKAHEVGCKGITIYRDNSRSGVLISDSKTVKEKSNGITYNSAPKRPETLKCDIYNISRNHKSFTIIVGLMEGKPYEIFAPDRISNKEFCDQIKEGTITKTKSKTYKLTGFNGTKKYIIDNVIDFMSDQGQNDTRKYSTQLRHGIHPKFIVEQIEEYATISSFDKVIAKVLRNYLGEEKLKSEKECPTCHGTNLRNESGCLTCNDCGWSKCG